MVFLFLWIFYGYGAPLCGPSGRCGAPLWRLIMISKVGLEGLSKQSCEQVVLWNTINLRFYMPVCLGASLNQTQTLSLVKLSRKRKLTQVFPSLLEPSCVDTNTSKNIPNYLLLLSSPSWAWSCVFNIFIFNYRLVENKQSNITAKDKTQGKHIQGELRA